MDEVCDCPLPHDKPHKHREKLTGTRLSALFRFPGIASFLTILLITGIEVVGLLLWLSLVSVGIVGIGQGTTFLIILLLLEHLIAQVEHVRRRLAVGEVIDIFRFSVLEGIIWTTWFLLIPINGIAAIAFFLIGLYVEHQISDNVKKGLPTLQFSGGLVSKGLLIFTLSEVIGASLWLILGPIGLIALIVGSTVEHYIATNVGRIPFGSLHDHYLEGTPTG